MRKLLTFVFCAALFLSDVSRCAHAVWIWDPKSGKWSNPKYDVKGSAKRQMNHAKGFEEKGKFERAAKEYRKLVKAYPTSPLAPYALVGAAENYRKSSFFYEAYQAYQMVIDKYPSYPDVQSVVEEEYKIANLFLSGKKKKNKLLKISLFTSLDSAIEIFRKVVENLPFGELSDDAQLKLGIAYTKQKKYIEAVDAFKKLLKDYPESPLCDEAKYRMGLCAYKQSKGSSYDQDATQRALEYFKEFLRDFPESKFVPEVKSKVEKLSQRKRKGLLDIAQYYDKVGEDRSAQVYYRQLMAEYPDSVEAKTAQEKIKVLNQSKSQEKSGGKTT